MPAPALGPTAEHAIALVEQAIALAEAAGDGSKTQDQAVQELASAGDSSQLEGARVELLRRIYQRSDDFPATKALTLVNRALAAVGWEDPFSWKHRRKP
jgi:hypothetical protein